MRKLVVKLTRLDRNKEGVATLEVPPQLYHNLDTTIHFCTPDWYLVKKTHRFRGICTLDPALSEPPLSVTIPAAHGRRQNDGNCRPTKCLNTKSGLERVDRTPCVLRPHESNMADYFSFSRRSWRDFARRPQCCRPNSPKTAQKIEFSPLKCNFPSSKFTRNCSKRPKSPIVLMINIQTIPCHQRLWQSFENRFLNVNFKHIDSIMEKIITI